MINSGISDSLDSIYVKWWDGESNFGDAINPILIEAISGGRVIFGANPIDKANYIVVGSILEMADSSSIVWGTGLISSEIRLKHIPKRIYAVRGPLTRDVLLSQEINCPAVFGDPVLLYPKFYFPRVSKKYKLGIIPHYVDQKNSWLDKFKNIDDMIIINILDDPHLIIQQICSCEKIVSSSLHGIIASDAYRVPSKWIILSDDVFGSGFKFRDYFLSVRKDDSGLRIDDSISINDLLSQEYSCNIEINLDELYNSCPFKSSLRILYDVNIRQKLQLEQAELQLEQALIHIKAMENSKFWKIRRLWLKLKSLL